MGKWGGNWATCAWFALAIASCDHGATAESPGKARPKAPVAEPATSNPTSEASAKEEGLLLGVFRLARDPVIDGDTIRVEGLGDSVRLLALDTEERLRGRDRAAASEDYDAYVKKKRGVPKRTQKFGTPMGEEAAEFARAFFDGVQSVRLERDDPKEIKGAYGRFLAYAMVQKNGRWTIYNVEAVRAGMSPYFTKYGYSRRFDKELALAEAEAKRAKRGIWSPDARGYGDYDERKAWWNARADFIRAFEHEAAHRDDHILLSHFDALERLEANLGKEVTLLSTVDQIKHFEKLVRVLLVLKRGKGFPLIFFDRRVFSDSGIADYYREPVRVRGRVVRYTKGDYATLQIVVEDPRQVTLPSLPPTN